MKLNADGLPDIPAFENFWQRVYDKLTGGQEVSFAEMDQALLGYLEAAGMPEAMLDRAFKAWIALTDKPH